MTVLSNGIIRFSQFRTFDEFWLWPPLALKWLNMILFSYPDPPIIDPAYPKDLNTTEEESVTLQCIIKESNPHANVTWIKLSDPGKVLSRGPVLNLTSVRHGDEGKYRCLVENGVGGQIKSRIAKLEVKRTLSAV